jgi:hypothetical protein
VQEVRVTRKGEGSGDGGPKMAIESNITTTISAKCRQNRRLCRTGTGRLIASTFMFLTSSGSLGHRPRPGRGRWLRV